MSFSNNSQCIHCSVSSCRHHDGENMCELDAIHVEPRCECDSGNCDESLCGSYHRK